MLCQLVADETLVPPNLRTTQALLLSDTDVNTHVELLSADWPWNCLFNAYGVAATPSDSCPLRGQKTTHTPLVVLEDVFELFLQLTLGKHVLDTAPGRLAALAGSRGFRPTLGALYQRIEFVSFFGFTEKLIVDIKMFVFAFAHCSRKTLEINRIDQPGA